MKTKRILFALMMLLPLSCSVVEPGIPKGIYIGTKTITVSMSFPGSEYGPVQNSSVHDNQVISITENGLPRERLSGNEMSVGSELSTTVDFGGEIGEVEYGFEITEIVQSGSRLLLLGIARVDILGVSGSGSFEATYDYVPPDRIEFFWGTSLSIVIEGQFAISTFETEGHYLK